MIHDTAIIDNSAKIGKNVSIGPYCVIGANVEISDNVEIMSHVCIDGYTKIGAETKIFPFAVIGFPPQDLKFSGEKSELIIGQRNVIREYVTMHPGTQNGEMTTTIGDHNLFMINVHIAHDCVIGNNIVFGNNATLAGHVTIEDNVIIGGLTAIHQFVRIGAHAIIGGMSGVERDVIPFGAVKGERAFLYGINMIGLKRHSVPNHDILELKKAYDFVFNSGATIAENISNAENTFKNNHYITEMLNFLKRDSNRSFCLPKG